MGRDQDLRRTYVTAREQPADICDICSAPDPQWLFQAEDVPMIGNRESFGAWLACDTCAPFLVNRDLEGLVRHVGDHWRGTFPPEQMTAVAAMLTNFYTDLFTHLTGDSPTIVSMTRANCHHPPERTKYADNVDSPNKEPSLQCGVCGALVDELRRPDD